MKNLFIGLGLIFLGCIQKPLTQKTSNFPLEEILTLDKDYFENILELYTFEIQNNRQSVHFFVADEVYGKAFIANGKIWSAAHLFNVIKQNPDTIDLGKSSMYGLTICNSKHKKGDFLYYKTIKRGVVQVVILEIKEFHYLGSLDKDMKGGDSGSPVFCKDHKKVVGVVSSYWSTHDELTRAGNIAKFPEKKE